MKLNLSKGLCTYLVGWIIQIPLLAQTGPAGVGNSTSNKLWLDASSLALTNGAGVGVWTDRSGNGWNAYQGTALRRPSFLSNQLNGYPVVRFDRSNGGQWLDITSAGIGAVMSNNSTLFAVAKANSGGASDGTGQWQSIFGAIDSYSGILFQGFPSTIRLYIDGWVGNPAANDLVIAPAIIQGEWYLATRMPKESSTGTTLSGFSNGTHAGSVSSNLQLKNHSNLIRMGACFTSGVYQYLLNGDIAEIILFNVSLNEAQRIVVENYLASKYNLPIANDYYISHALAYIKDVQGIGTTDGSLSKHSAASNSGGMLISEINNTLNGSNEFLFMGHASSGNAIVSTDMHSAEQNRWQRVWYVEKTGTIDAKLSFDFSQAAINPPANLNAETLNYKLLYRSSPSENFTIVKNGSDALVPVVENGDQLAFPVLNSDLPSGYYTLGYLPDLVWTGALSENWSEPGNWNLNRTPLSQDHVFINSCATCPTLNQPVSIGRLKMTDGSKLNLSNFSLITESTHLIGADIISNSGILRAGDFEEIKTTDFSGAVTLEKTGGSDNQCHGGNTFSPELKVSNLSTKDFQIATEANNVIH